MKSRLLIHRFGESGVKKYTCLNFGNYQIDHNLRFALEACCNQLLHSIHNQIAINYEVALNNKVLSIKNSKHCWQEDEKQTVMFKEAINKQNNWCQTTALFNVQNKQLAEIRTCLIQIMLLYYWCTLLSGGQDGFRGYRAGPP